MSTKVLQELITLQSGTQIVIDKIAEIIVNELTNQQALAAGLGEDPDLYKARVYTQRFNPLDQFENDKTPLINIEMSDDSTSLSVTGTSGKNQKSTSIFIDCYGAGQAGSNGTGQIVADKSAAMEANRISSLIRYILTSDINDNIQLDRKLVNSVVLVSEQFFVPDFDSRQSGPVCAMRLTLQCNINDQVIVNNGVPLESIVVDIERDDSGQVYTTVEYDYTQ
jgi:hypothetical protein